jgi:hypothetical protein
MPHLRLPAPIIYLYSRRTRIFTHKGIIIWTSSPHLNINHVHLHEKSRLKIIHPSLVSTCISPLEQAPRAQHELRMAIIVALLLHSSTIPRTFQGVHMFEVTGRSEIWLSSNECHVWRKGNLACEDNYIYSFKVFNGSCPLQTASPKNRLTNRILCNRSLVL